MVLCFELLVSCEVKSWFLLNRIGSLREEKGKQIKETLLLNTGKQYSLCQINFVRILHLEAGLVGQV